MSDCHTTYFVHQIQCDRFSRNVFAFCHVKSSMIVPSRPFVRAYILEISNTTSILNDQPRLNNHRAQNRLVLSFSLSIYPTQSHSDTQAHIVYFILPVAAKCQRTNHTIYLRLKSFCRCLLPPFIYACSTMYMVCNEIFQQLSALYCVMSHTIRNEMYE